ncbi:zinc-dependent metalloprotease [Cumulibacter manganitolerans]|uniref:zinc-dependent metalloprotease n=1 Tax=Cumulibacter manganitolerans TaxID=1884992 RepID=UPI001296749C|nr:zinc-dependent metalloprotease [Cumulibacter manganitolerans]
MTKPPFGFNGPGPDDDDSSDDQSPSQQNPFGFGFPGMPGLPGGQLPADMSALMPMIQQIQQMLAGQGQSSGPVNWDLAKQTAIQAARAGEKRTATTRDQALQAIPIGDLWLEDSTTFPSGIKRVEVWSRTEWISQTLDVWAKLCDPVAAKMVSAMTSLMPEGGLAQIPGMPAIPGFEKVLAGMGGMMFGGQVGHALAQLSTEVLTSTDIGLPLGPDGTAVLVGQNVDALIDSLGMIPDEVRLYLGMREAAYHRLFSHVPWLRKKLLSTIEAYASGISIDKNAIEQSLSEVSPEDLQTNPQKIQEIMSSGVFEPQETEAQKQQLAALETLLALIEGWVDRVVTHAANDRLPVAGALSEMMRRRRATGGPAEQTFATLVGLELRPRRLRDAAAMWERIEAAEGIAGRDKLWEHPDLLPTSEDFGTPAVEPGEHAGGEPTLTDADFEALLSWDGGAARGGDAAEPQPPTGEDPEADGPGDDEPGPRGTGS